MTTLTLVLTAVGSVLLLLFLVMKARMHAFLALMVVSMGAGLFSGMPLDKIAATMEKGMGGTLGFLAVVVALGAMFGKILHETGAVDQIAVKMLKSFGHSRAHYAIGLAGLVCALPLFFEVAEVHNRQTAIEWAASELSLALPVKMTSDKIRSELAQRGYRFPQWTERSVVK